MAELDAKPKGRSHVTKLINLAIASHVEFFRSPEGELYATVPIGDSKETLVLSEKPFRNWLARTYFIAQKTGVSGGSVSDAVMTLSGHAYASSCVYPVYTRVAAVDSRVYLDLGRDDRHALRMTPEGWTLGPVPDDIRFVRRTGTLPLADPVRGGNLAELLPTIININQGPSLTLLIAWLIGCLRGLKPYPILVITGEHGTCKTGACKAARQIIDPSQADLSLTPKEPRDLVIAARNSHVLGFDNLSYIPDWLSDTLCAVATGSGFRTRTLTTDNTETIFASANPVVLNSIADVVTRGDLMDRALTIILEPVLEDARKTEAHMNAIFRAVQPAILGALADAVVQAIKQPVVLRVLPRMADFAQTIESAAPALGWKPQEFMNIYNASRQTAVDAMIDGDLIVDALKTILNHVTPNTETKEIVWTGTSKELRDEIVKLTPEKDTREKQFPKTPQALVGKLRRLAPTLRGLGIFTDDPRNIRVGNKVTRLLTILYQPPEAQGWEDPGM